MATNAYLCRDCGLTFTDYALARAHISETLAAARLADTTARSHTIITLKHAHIVKPWTGDIESMFDNMRTLN